MRRIPSVLLCLIVLLASSAGPLHAAQDSPPVTRLKQLFAENTEFRHTAELMLQNVQDRGDASPNPWRGRDFDDLFDFLNDWFYFLPDAHNGLDRIVEFSLLYFDNPHGLEFVLGEPGRAWTLYFVQERGRYMDSPESTAVLDEWLQDRSIDHGQFVAPLDGFASFNEFFVRDLVPGARDITAPTSPSVLVSPADGIINVIDNDLALDREIPSKAPQTMSLRNLLRDSVHAARFVGGTAIAVFLMPDNYHHFHAPVSGVLLESDSTVGDRLFGVPDLLDMVNRGNPGYGKDYSVFEQFRHGYFIIDSGDYGLVGMIPIGLQTVGSVVFERPYDGIRGGSEVQLHKGEKLGHFAYGGSTVLLVFEPGVINAVSIRQGQQIGQLRAKR